MAANKKNLRHARAVRIIGGQWRGRKLPVVEQSGLRPTGDRLRETLFNWLMPDISGARCLDAFAGSGALGFEALSRGAGYTCFVESQAPAADQLRKNCLMLDCRQAHVAHADFMTWSAEDEAPFDIIFVDPPFSAVLWQACIHHIQHTIPMTRTCIVYIESPKDQSFTTPDSWQRHKHKTNGHISATLYKTSSPNPG